MKIRRAAQTDVAAVAAIYECIHDLEERGETSTGWLRGIYPTEATARISCEKGDLYVLEENGAVVAAARINREQGEEYAACAWRYDAPPEQVLVLHTLVVDPRCKGKGFGSAFVRYYEDMGRRLGTPYLRMDTNEKNRIARRLYAYLGYDEPGIVGCVFNGIPDVQLVCLEKKL